MGHVKYDWNQMFDLYKEYKAEFGEPKTTVIYQAKRLGSWCCEQRRFQNDLSDEARKQLESVGFPFTLATKDLERKIELYKRFKNEFKRDPVSPEDKYEGENLYSWMKRLQKMQNNGQLPIRTVLALEEAGFDFSATQKEKTWQNKFREYKELIEAGQELPAPLYSWFQYQISLQDKGQLSDAHLERLNSVQGGFPPEILTQKEKELYRDFDLNLGLFKAFVSVYGRHPRQTEKFEDTSIGTWTAQMRHMYQTGSLSEERTTKLLEAGFVFSIANENWENHCKAVEEYIEKFGMQPLRTDRYKGMPIGAWLNTQRLAYNRGSLDANRIAALIRAGVSLSNVAENANDIDMLAGFQRFVKENGQFPKTTDRYKTRSLGQWMKRIQQDYAEGLLDDELKALLIESRFPLPAKALTWDEMLEYYKGYKQRTGKEPVPGNTFQGIRVGVWATEQRSRNDLTIEQTKKLKDAKFALVLSSPTFSEGLKQYKDFKKSHAEEPSIAEIHNGCLLGEWCATCFTKLKKGTFSEKETKRLLDAGFPIYQRSQKQVMWQDHFNAYCQYKKEHHIEPHRDTQYKGFMLGTWVVANRVEYRRCCMPADRIEKLKQAGFDFDPRFQCFARLANAYKDFKDQTGQEPTKDILVYYSYIEIPERLGSWYEKTKTQYLLNQLQPEYKEKLDEVGFLVPVEQGRDVR